jgi:hypothetical protein
VHGLVQGWDLNPQGSGDVTRKTTPFFWLPQILAEGAIIGFSQNAYKRWCSSFEEQG